MVRTITEKFVNGELVERITVEDGKPIIPARPIITDDPMPYWDATPWWGITPPPHPLVLERTITTTYADLPSANSKVIGVFPGFVVTG